MSKFVATSEKNHSSRFKNFRVDNKQKLLRKIEVLKDPRRKVVVWNNKMPHQSEFQMPRQTTILLQKTAK